MYKKKESIFKWFCDSFIWLTLVFSYILYTIRKKGSFRVLGITFLEPSLKGKHFVTPLIKTFKRSLRETPFSPEGLWCSYILCPQEGACCLFVYSKRTIDYNPGIWIQIPAFHISSSFIYQNLNLNLLQSMYKNKRLNVYLYNWRISQLVSLFNVMFCTLLKRNAIPTLLI